MAENPLFDSKSYTRFRPPSLEVVSPGLRFSRGDSVPPPSKKRRPTLDAAKSVAPSSIGVTLYRVHLSTGLGHLDRSRGKCVAPTSTKRRPSLDPGGAPGRASLIPPESRGAESRPGRHCAPPPLAPPWGGGRVAGGRAGRRRTDVRGSGDKPCLTRDDASAAAIVGPTRRRRSGETGAWIKP